MNSPTAELVEVKSLLYQAMKQIEEKNEIIEKFTQFKNKVEAMKNEEINNIHSLFIQEREKEEELYNQQILTLKGQIEEEKNNTNQLMEIFESKTLFLV